MGKSNHKAGEEIIKSAKARWDVLIVYPRAIGIAYLIPAITNWGRQELLWTFKKWFVLERFLKGENNH